MIRQGYLTYVMLFNSFKGGEEEGQAEEAREGRAGRGEQGGEGEKKAQEEEERGETKAGYL